MSDIGIDLTANDATAKFTVGTCMTAQSSAGSKSYRYVQYSSGAGSVAAVADMACYIQKVATAGVTGR